MKLALRLATRVPTGGAPRRAYQPGAPLFARRPLKFHGVQYAKGDALPVDEMSKVRHHRMWLSGLADHAKHGPFDKRKKQAQSELAKAPAVEIIPELNKDPIETFVADEAPSQRNDRRNKRR